MTRKNNKGFSLIELLIVIAILGVTLTITVGSLTSQFHARSYQAAKTVDGMISQSKINAMSGKKNILAIYYDQSQKKYVCNLYIADSSGKGSYTNLGSGYLYVAEPYESETFGNSSLVLSAAGYKLINDDGTPNGTLVIDYKMDTGAIDSVRYFSQSNGMQLFSKNGTDLYQLSGGAYLLGGTSTNKTTNIDFSFYTNHSITIYKSTGEHEYN